MPYVCDLESTGIDPYNCEVIWCAVIKEIGTDNEFFFTPSNITDLTSHFALYPGPYVMHNGISYDRILLKTVLDINIPINQVYDTLLLSRMLYPDLASPDGWKGKPKPHSLEAWGTRFGINKPTHEDWTQFSEEMLYRCHQDVLINEQLWIKMNKELKW